MNSKEKYVCATENADGSSVARGGTGDLGHCATAAFAEQGESSSWHFDPYNGNSLLYTSDTPSVQYVQGHGEITVWRSNSDAKIYLSVDGDAAVGIPGATTNVAPTVVPYGNNGYAIFYTDQQDGIWWIHCDSEGGKFTSPARITGNSTLQSVSVTQIGGFGSNQLFMMYKGFGNDNRIFQVYYNGRSWGNAQAVPGATTFSQPAVTWSPNGPTGGSLTAVHRGTNDIVYYASQVVGTDRWTPWTEVPGPGRTPAGPAIAATRDGNIEVAVMGEDHGPWYQRFNPANGLWNSGWQTVAGSPKSNRRPSLGNDDGPGRNAIRIDHQGTDSVAYGKTLLSK